MIYDYVNLIKDIRELADFLNSNPPFLGILPAHKILTSPSKGEPPAAKTLQNGRNSFLVGVIEMKYNRKSMI
jgi:hypothetical protein